jgi:hypothetical protein
MPSLVSMTSLLDPPPPPAHPPPDGPAPHRVLAAVEWIGSSLDRVAEVPAWAMSSAEQRETLVALARTEARLAELRLRVLAAADTGDVGAEVGATSTAAWLADATGRTRAACSRDVRLAGALDSRFEATRRALAAGDIDTERAGVIVHAVQALSEEHDDLPPGTHHRAEAHLLDLAAEYDAARLRVLGKRLYEVACPEAADEAEGRKLAAEEERARRLAYLSMRDDGQGTTEGRFRLPTLHAQLLKKALDALTSPRRLGQGRCDPTTGAKLPYSTLLGHGLIELLEDHLDLDTMPSEPGTGGSPFTLVITVGLDALRTGLGVAAIETGTRISAGDARRLACKAGIIPMVLDTNSVPVDLGRERRLFTKHQRIALNHTYRGCAATNCDRPPSWTEAHHLDPWSHGGRTDLDRGIPLCPPHHHMADNPAAWDMHRLPNGRVRFSRRT